MNIQCYKYILAGNIDGMINLFDIVPSLTDYIELYISDNPSANIQYKNIKCKHYSILFCEMYKKFKIVISDNEYEKIKKLLVRNYGINDNQCISFNAWFANMLKTHSEIIIIPKSIRLDLSTACQLNCVDCYMRKQNNGSIGSGYVKFSDFKELLDENPFIEHIEISNSGEPFLNPDINKILSYAHKKGVVITVNNGTNFNDVSDETLELMVKNNNILSIAVSIDGTSQETYSIYRRKGNFDKVINNIKKLNKYKEKYNSIFPRLIYYYIVMEHNEHEIEEAIKLAEDLNMELIFRKEWSNTYIPKNKKKVEMITGLNYDEKINSKLQVFSYCKDMIFSPQINWDGKLLGCCVVFRNFWNKNVFQDGFISAINSKEYRQNIIDLLEYNTDKIKSSENPCHDCQYVKQNSYDMNICGEV